MKLSQVLKDWPGSRLTREEREVYGLTTVGSKYDEGFNTALESCDREIDREVLARDIKSSRSLYRWEIRDKQIGDEIKDENEFIAACIISTMPTWLIRI